MTAEEIITSNGYEDVVILKDLSYDSALIGISEDNRAIYDHEKMVAWCIKTQNWTEEEAREWIDYNTVRALGYAGDKAPIIMYPLITDFDGDEDWG